MSFERLRKFISEEMWMSQVYQPVMLIELLRNKGKASTSQIAQALLQKDPTQIEYFTEIVKNMVGRILTKKRGITERNGNTYSLLGAADLTADETQILIELCEVKIAEFEEKRGQSVWSHRRRGYRPISGSVKYQVFTRAKFRCELCGVSAEDKALEVDHILPKSRGGKNDLSNYQALCYSCNSAKRNTDDTDFRNFKEMYEHRADGCLFCGVMTKEPSRVISENSLAFAIRDGFPVSEGHTLIIPKRHTSDYFDLVPAEVSAVNLLLQEQRKGLLDADRTIGGFNIGMNCGEEAGQTVLHCHVHLIPRRAGDVKNPKGGVRHVIPNKGDYTSMSNQRDHHSHNASSGEHSVARGVENRRLLSDEQMAKLEKAGAALPLAMMQIYDPDNTDPTAYVERILGIIGGSFHLSWDDEENKWTDD